MHHLSLTDGWTVGAVDGPVPADVPATDVPAVVPGCVHTDLLRAGLITDPFDGDAETHQQWIGDVTWRWRTIFRWTDDGSERHDLVADGLDTVARVELNGRLVAETENAHRSYRSDVGALLVEGDNELVVTIAAPVPEAERRSEAHGPRPHVNHHPFNALRKPAYDFGWDWGVDAASSGISRPIGIESWSGVRVASVRPLVDLDGADGVLDAHVDLERSGGATGDGPVVVVVEVAGQRAEVEVPAGSDRATAVVRVPDVDVWWPRGHGAQPLHEVTVSATVGGGAGATGDSGAATATWRGRVGFRTVELDTTPDEHGTPFVLRVNGEVVRVRGANWIPDHVFLTEMTPERYRRRVRDAVEMNVDLLRVWGGGVYESADFYDACDEAGVLVWQDFAFACAAYAEEPWLADEVEAEAREAVTRLSPHPSLVIWNGCNENVWAHEDWGWKAELGDLTWGAGYYFDVLPRIVGELDPSRPYSPGSPFSFAEGVHPNDAAHGTMHLWDVWNTRDYTVYAEHEPRFASEFGFQGPPSWTTLTRTVHDEPMDPYGPQMLVHQKAHDGNLKLERGLRGHLPEPRSIEDWHWATQLNQAAALRFGVEHFRSLAPRSTGTIVWQLNDDWPVVSWAAVDSDERRKPLWHALRAAYEPQLATVQPRDGGLALVLVDDSTDGWRGTATVRRLSFAGEELAAATLDVAVGARGEVTVPLPAGVVTPGDASGEVVVVDLPGHGTARAWWHPAEVVDQQLDPGAVRASAARREDGAVVVTVSASSLARDVTLLVDVADPTATVDRGMVSLLAGETADFVVEAAPEADPASFTSARVVRHAAQLLG